MLGKTQSKRFEAKENPLLLFLQSSSDFTEGSTLEASKRLEIYSCQILQYFCEPA